MGETWRGRYCVNENGVEKVGETGPAEQHPHDLDSNSKGQPVWRAMDDLTKQGRVGDLQLYDRTRIELTWRDNAHP